MKLTEFIGITSKNMHLKFEAVWRSYNFWQKNAQSAGPWKKDEIMTFSQSSPKFMKLTEFIGITSKNMHLKFEAVWRSYNFWQKNADSAPDLRKRMKLWHFLKVLQNSWNLQNLLESPPRTCIWNLWQFGEVTIFDRKMPTAPDLRKRMKLWHFLKVLKNSWNLQNLLESLPETCMWNLRLFGEVTIFDSKMPTAPDPRKRMKLWHFLKVLQNSWNLQNLLESPPETCMWNLRQFGEDTIFDRKMPTATTLEKGWNYDIFSKFSKIHETYRIYWNHLQKHACEIWGCLEKLQFLTEKCPKRWILKKGWNNDIFSKFSEIHETYRIYWNHLQKHACKIWGSLEKLQFLTEKCRQRRTLEKEWDYDIFSKFSNIHETYRIYWNHYQKHACEIWGCLEKLQFLTVKCLQRRTLGKRWNYDIFSKFSKIRENYRIYWNHLQKHACEIWGSLEKLQFLTEKCRQRRTLVKGWNYDIFSKFSKIHESYRIYWNHLQEHASEIWGSLEKLQFLTEKCRQRRLNYDIFSKFSKINETYRIYWNHYQKHACEIWGCLEKLQFLTEKCRQRRTLEKGWNYDIFSKFSKIHETYRIYWNHLQEHASEIWGSLEKLQFLTEKCQQRRTWEKGWNYDIFSKFSKIHETYRIYWNHYQKHACEIWGCLEKLQFLTVKCLQRRTLEKRWNYDIFSKFFKIHETYRIYWNHLQEHASEIWGSLEKLQFSTEKCLQRRTLEKRWNYDIFSKLFKIHKNYRIYWNHLQKHACEIWGSLEKLQFLTEKCRQRLTLEKGWNYDIFSKFSKIHETYRIYWNHYQKHACEIWGCLEKLQFLTGKCLQRRTLEKGWNYDIFSKFSKIHETYRIYWNHLQKHACEIWGSLEKLQFLTEKCPKRRTLEKGWNNDIFSKFSEIHETYRIYWNHLQKHASEIWGSLEKLQFLTVKCLQRRTLEKGWNYDIFSKFSKIHETYRIYWNHLQEHASEIWGSLEKFQFLTVKCLQRRPVEKGWNYDIFLKFSKIHETYRIYWNHYQKHACEIWGCLEKLLFLTVKCLQRRTLEKGWNYDIFSKFSKIHETYRIYWNHFQKHASEIWGCLEKLQFLTEKCRQRRTL